MAAVFDLDQAQGDRASQMVDVGLTAIQTAVAPLHPKAALGEIARARRFLSGLEADVLATEVPADGNTSRAERRSRSGPGKGHPRRLAESTPVRIPGAARRP